MSDQNETYYPPNGTVVSKERGEVRITEENKQKIRGLLEMAGETMDCAQAMIDLESTARQKFRVFCRSILLSFGCIPIPYRGAVAKHYRAWRDADSVAKVSARSKQEAWERYFAACSELLGIPVEHVRLLSAQSEMTLPQDGTSATSDCYFATHTLEDQFLMTDEPKLIPEHLAHTPRAASPRNSQVQIRVSAEDGARVAQLGREVAESSHYADCMSKHRSATRREFLRYCEELLLTGGEIPKEKEPEARRLHEAWRDAEYSAMLANRSASDARREYQRASEKLLWSHGYYSFELDGTSEPYGDGFLIGARDCESN